MKNTLLASQKAIGSELLIYRKIPPMMTHIGTRLKDCACFLLIARSIMYDH